MNAPSNPAPSKRAPAKAGHVGLLLVALVACVGCGDDDGGSIAEAGAWGELAGGDWTLDAGSEDYLCVRAIMTEDTYVNAFRPIAPPGTHHTVLSVETTPQGPSGAEWCSAGTNGESMIYGSGIGTETLELPEGVAVKVEKGQAVLLNLHLFNVGSETLSGYSAVEGRIAKPDDVVDIAEAILAGPMGGELVIPPGQSTQSGDCTITQDATIFAVLPHMHQLGMHLQTTVMSGSESTVIHDAPYDFDEQKYDAPSGGPHAVRAGDVVRTACTYDNATMPPATVRWGDSSDAEMCFSGLYMYPRAERANHYCKD